MAWREKEDLGTQLVAHVHESLRIPDDYTVDEIRGFEWWASDYGQRVWSDLGNFHNASCLYRLHAEIDMFRGQGHSGDAELAIGQAMTDGTLSGIVYDSEKDLYKLHCSVYAHYDNEAWVKKVFNAAVALQVAEAHRLANQFTREFKMAHAMTEHPRKGSRKTPDQICEFEQRFFKPYGAAESKWVGVEEWEDGRQALRRISNDLKTDYKLSLEASFDWSYGQRDMALVVSAVDPHSILGSGLMFNLSLPIMMEDSVKGHVAMLLNEHERLDWNWYNDIGSWCIKGGELTFTCFVPNICYIQGILADFCHDMGLRANWVHEQWGQLVKQAWMLS